MRRLAETIRKGTGSDCDPILDESCIRVVTSVNIGALEACDDDVLKKLGWRRERDDKFHYEVTREEIKL